jgi:hypothetical protein
MSFSASTFKKALFLAACIALLGGCVRAHAYQRGKLADPMMSLTDDQLENYRKQKLYNTREGASGGDGSAAGGGCGCH